MAIKREQIKRDLLEQFKNKGVSGSHYLALIDSYMDMWDIERKLIADIEERGVSVPLGNRFKKNESITELTKTNAQMLKILNALGLKASESVAGDSEEM